MGSDHSKILNLQIGDPLEVIDEDPSVPPVTGTIIAITRTDGGTPIAAVLRLLDGQIAGVNLEGAVPSTDAERNERHRRRLQ